MRTRSTLGLAPFLLAGCANMHLESSGFLADFGRLEPAPELQVAFVPDAVLWWEKEGLDWSRYAEVVVAPVEWRPVGERARKTSAKHAEALCQDFREELAEGLATRPRAPDATGSATLRAAITDVASSNVLLNVVAVIVLFPIDMGGIRGEIEVRDTRTGELLAAMSAYREGTPLLLIECFSRYGHARHGMEKWTKLLRRAMTQEDERVTS